MNFSNIGRYWPLLQPSDPILPAKAELAVEKQVDNQLDVLLIDQDGALRVAWVVGAGAWA